VDDERNPVRIAVPDEEGVVCRPEIGDVPRVIAKGPEGKPDCTVDLEPPRAVLLGRAPDPETAPRAPEADPCSFQPVTVLGASVSANHALVWSDRGTLCVRDLGSKNGTWLLLPRNQTVRVAGEDVVLHLAQASDETAADEEPAPPGWTGRRDFATTVAESVYQWLRRRGVDALVAVASERGQDAEPPTRIPLATGEAIDVAPLATAHAHWSRLLDRLWRWVARQNSLYEAEQEARDAGVILASRPIRVAHREIVDVAQAGARTLLLTGPSGAGKEVLAEAFHRHSGRSGPFVAVNCSMFSKDLLRAELFGAEAGSFTGAARRILGAVERAQGGTLFLDEIGDISPEIQPMLLRFLDRREYATLGHYGRTQRADVRVVAATNRDLRDGVREGRFRVDLWFRLSVHVVDVPPLRVRWDDVLAYLESVRADGGRCSMREALSPEALEVLRAHPWDGNFRELTNFTERLPRNARAGCIDAAACQRALERGALRVSSAPPSDPSAAQADWASLVSCAVQAFVEDHGREPQTWDDQKEWNEKYLKPLLFFQMSGATQLPTPYSESALTSLAAQTAGRLRADRGTATKQLTRYFERFRARP
jgi:DNA-binding NtrC family response regulator